MIVFVFVCVYSHRSNLSKAEKEAEKEGFYQMIQRALAKVPVTEHGSSIRNKHSDAKSISY